MTAEASGEPYVLVQRVVADYAVLVPVVVVVIAGPRAVNLEQRQRIVSRPDLMHVGGRVPYFEVVEAGCSVGHDGPDLLLEEIVVDLEVFNAWLLAGGGTPAAEVVPSQSLPPKVDPRGIDDQRTVQAWPVGRVNAVHVSLPGLDGQRDVEDPGSGADSCQMGHMTCDDDGDGNQ